MEQITYKLQTCSLSENINKKIAYELVCVPYNVDKELDDNYDNIEFESYYIYAKINYKKSQQ